MAIAVSMKAKVTHTRAVRHTPRVRFYEREEVKDLIAYLRVTTTPSHTCSHAVAPTLTHAHTQLVHNERDDTAFERIVNVPKRSIGAKTLQHLKAARDAEGKTQRKSLFLAHDAQQQLLPQPQPRSLVQLCRALCKHPSKPLNGSWHCAASVVVRAGSQHLRSCAPGWKAAKRTVTALRSFLTALDAFAERCRTSSSVGGVLAWLVEHIDYAKHIQVLASHSGTLWPPSPAL